jgi:hypothetical protein
MSLKRIAYLRNNVFGYRKYHTLKPLRSNRDPNWCATNTMEELADATVYSQWGIEYEDKWWKCWCWSISIWLLGMAFAIINLAYPNAKYKVRVE